MRGACAWSKLTPVMCCAAHRSAHRSPLTALLAARFRPGRRVLHAAVPPPPPARAAPNTEAEVRALLDALPAHVKPALAALCATAGLEILNLVEINVQIGRRPEAIFALPQGGKRRELIVDAPRRVRLTT